MAEAASSEKVVKYQQFPLLVLSPQMSAWTKRPAGGLLEHPPLPQGPARGAGDAYVPRLITSTSSWITPYVGCQRRHTPISPRQCGQINGSRPVLCAYRWR